MSKINVDLTKLFTENNYDVTIQPQGKGDYGDGVMCKVETMDSTGDSIKTKKKVTVFGFGKSIASAERDALTKALSILNLSN